VSQNAIPFRRWKAQSRRCNIEPSVTAAAVHALSSSARRMRAEDVRAFVDLFEMLLRWDRRYSINPVVPRREPELDTSEPASTSRSETRYP
jgi:hypothetical protein